MASSVVIVGAGHGGVQAAVSLREDGFKGEIVLLSDETELPYQRPPLSKAFLKGAMGLDGLPLRAEAYFRDHDIALRLGVRATRIDREQKRVETSNGQALVYDDLILATGSRHRPLPVPGVDLPGVHVLKTIAEASALRAALKPGLRVVIVGAGFIGLEIAATAVAMGCAVTVVEIARPMGRAVSPVLSDFFHAAHVAFGATIRLGVGVTAIRGETKAGSVALSDGETLPADLVVVGVGALAEDRLARDCGLECRNGIVVDAFLRTSDPSISAIGDCAEFPNAALGVSTRLESVQNAVDQAKCVAARIAGKATKPYDALAWFWSDQGDLKLQIAGLAQDVDQWVTRGDPATRAFTTLGFRKGKLAVVETVNRGGDHAAARRILGEGKTLTPEQAADPAFDLKALALGKSR